MRTPTTAAAIMAFVALTGSASAAYHTYAGDECVVWAGSTCNFNYGACENPGSSTQYIDCPAHKTGSFSSATIVVRDRSAQANLRCQLCAWYPVTGTSSLSGGCEPWNSTSGADANFDPLYTYSSEITVPSAYAFYYFSCEIPGIYGGNRSGVQSYWVLQN